jgi:N-acetylglucosaminyldiphosphoundecaprenol N-acetyl-beta-D-mannosaminyltransferase
MYIDIFNQRFFSGTTNEAIDVIHQFIQKRSLSIIGAINVYLLTECSKNKWLSDFYNDSCNMVTVDGRPLVYLSKILSKYPFPEMVGGPGLWLKILEYGSKQGLKFYFIGATDEILRKSKTNLEEQFNNISIVGYHNGYFSFDSLETEKIVSEIEKYQPDIIYLGMPSPKKEEFALILKKRLEYGLIVLIGGAFDYFAGEKKIGNNLISKLCLDWILRMMQEPKRLIPRYMKSNFDFFKLIIRHFFKINYLKIKK